MLLEPDWTTQKHMWVMLLQTDWKKVIYSLSVKQSVADQLDNLEIYDGRQYKPQWGSV